MSTGHTTVQMQDGCYGVQMASDGREFNAKPGGHVDVPDSYLPELRSSNAARSGMVIVDRAFSLATRRGRVCPVCQFQAQVWTTECPRGHGPTLEAQ